MIKLKDINDNSFFYTVKGNEIIYNSKFSTFKTMNSTEWFIENIFKGDIIRVIEVALSEKKEN